MGTKISIRTRMAIVSDGHVVTDYDYDFVHETDNEIILYSDFKMVIYSKKTGERLGEFGTSPYMKDWLKIGKNCIAYNVIDGYRLIKSDCSKRTDKLFDTCNLIEFGKEIFFEVSIKGKKGLYDSECKEIIPVKYDSISKVSSEKYLVIVHNDGKRGLYNLNGECILDAIYDKINIHSNCIEVYSKDTDERSIYTRDGKTKILSGHNWFYAISNIYGMISIHNQSNGTYSLYSEDGTPILEEYDYIEVGDIMADHAIIARKNWKYGLFDFNGKELLPCVYENINFGGMNRYEGGTVSIIDDEGNRGVYSVRKGKIVIPPKKYAKIISYENGICEMVTEEKVHGYYLSKEDKFVKAEDINITKSGLYEFLCDGGWQLYTELKTQTALFVGGQQIIDYGEYEIRNRPNEIVLYNNDGFKIFDKISGQKLFEWNDGNYKLESSNIILSKLADECQNEMIYSVISYKGKEKVSFELKIKEIHMTSFSNIFRVIVNGDTKLYFSTTNQFIEGVSVRKNYREVNGSYEIYSNGKWNLYVRKKDKYVFRK